METRKKHVPSEGVPRAKFRGAHVTGRENGAGIFYRRNSGKLVGLAQFRSPRPQRPGGHEMPKISERGTK